MPARGEATMECTRCGRCMDICPQGAIDYCLIATNIRVRPVYVTLAVVLSLLLLSGFVTTLVHFVLSGEIAFL